jgi:hypothetical protein
MFRNFGEAGFAEAPETLGEKSKCKCAITMTTLNLILTRAHSALIFSPFAFYRLKKGKMFGLFFGVLKVASLAASILVKQRL